MQFRFRSPACRTIAAALGAWMAFAASTAPVSAGDWPQILGPNRDGVAVDEQLADAWPDGGPKTLWQRDVGQGLAGVAVAGDRLVLFHRLDDEEVAEALDAQTGQKIWTQSFPTSYHTTYTNDLGPRCVPLIHDGHVYLFGAQGDLHCLDLSSGEVRWSRAAGRDFDAPEGYFGAGSTPLVEDGKLLVNVGGRNGAGIVAFDLATGETAWQATDEAASYSSPCAVTLDGVRHVLFVTRLNLVSIDPRDGGERFSIPFGKRGPTVNAATPLVVDGHVFVTANYGVGALFARIGADSVTPVWENDDVMSSQYATGVFHQGHLYGIDGGDSIGAPTRLRCIDPFTAEVRWTEDCPNGALLLAGDKLLLLGTDGRLTLVAPSPVGYRRLATASVLRTETRALPALSGGRLYVRDTRTLKCLQVGAE